LLIYQFVVYFMGPEIGMVLETGDRTVKGRIAGSTDGLHKGATHIHVREIMHFVHLITAAAVALDVIFFFIALLFIGYTWIIY
jgi:sodium/potassium-transporting ATPase subunit alpha